MKPTESQIKEMADLLECGFQCFFHKPTGTIESHPNATDIFFDLESWQEIFDKIESDWDNYQELENMDSTESFNVMRDFVDSLTNDNAKMRFEYALDRPKPFRNFKYEIDRSEYRDDWFKFRQESYMNWVRKQLVDQGIGTKT